MENKGRLIVFEGIDGAGKTTQIELLTSYLRDQKNRRVYRTAEPTESVTGGLLRDALGGIVRRSPCELAALFVLDRIFHNVNPVNGIEKLTGEGVDVISDRYYYSSMAYQGSETDPEWVGRMNLDCPEIRRPDICIFLDLTPEQSMKRILKGRVTQEIYETHERLEAVRNRFMKVIDDLRAKGENIHIVNADRSIEEIQAEIRQIVDQI